MPSFFAHDIGHEVVDLSRLVTEFLQRDADHGLTSFMMPPPESFLYTTCEKNGSMLVASNHGKGNRAVGAMTDTCAFR